MKKTAIFFALLFSGLFCQAQWRDVLRGLEDSGTVRQLKEDVAYLASAALEGRAAGSEGEKEAARYVMERFEAAGLVGLCPGAECSFGIVRQEGDTLVSRNAAAVLPGSDPALSDRYIVIGARLDNLGADSLVVDGLKVPRIYYGANGNASGLAMLCALADRMALRPAPRRSLLFVAFGASRETFAGAWYFLGGQFAGKIDAMINLDMLGGGDSDFVAYAASNQDLVAVLSALDRELLPVHPATVTEEPAPSDHRAFYAKEIPSVYLSTGLYPERDSERDTADLLDYESMERRLEFTEALAVKLCNRDKAPVFNRQSPGTSARDVWQYYDLDRRPTFLGSGDPKYFLEKWVYQYLKYPEAAVRQGIQGRVIVQFTVDAQGKVRDVNVIRGVHELLDAEAVRVVEASPKWRAGRMDGKAVSSVIQLPVDFRLDRKKGKFSIKR